MSQGSHRGQPSRGGGFAEGLALSVVGGVFVGGVTSFLFWVIWAFFWMPNWGRLREAGIYFHDVGGTFQVIGAFVVLGPAYVILTALYLAFSKRRRPRTAITVFAVVPAVLIALSNVRVDSYYFYAYPGEELAVFIVGLLWSLLLRRLTRFDHPESVP